MCAACKCTGKEHANRNEEQSEQRDDLISLLLLFHCPVSKLEKKGRTPLHFLTVNDLIHLAVLCEGAVKISGPDGQRYKSIGRKTLPLYVYHIPYMVE